KLEVTLKGLEDPIQDQLSSLLSSCIKSASINDWTFTKASDFPLCTHILRNSTFLRLGIRAKRLEDDIAGHIHSLTSKAQTISIACYEKQLSDQAAFITNLASSLIFVDLRDRSCTTSSFFGLPHSFWNTFLNENHANSSFESIETGNMTEWIMEAPFVLPDTPIEWLEWHKKI
ncbi:hypothetical protein PMAYCL1PPCAC_22375, partial [Pristionchus mayeri]